MFLENSKDKTLELVCEALDQLADTFSPCLAEKRLMVEMYGWNTPSLSWEDLANIPRCLAKDIRSLQIEELPEDLNVSLESISDKVGMLQLHTVPTMLMNGNILQALPAYMATMDWISMQIRPLLLWQSMQDPKAMPPNLLHKLASQKRQIDEISINKDELTSHIKAIQEAKETAESLPANLLSLKDAQSTINDRLLKSGIDNQKIFELKEASINHEKNISEKLLQAEQLISQCEEAYKVSTTKGLAGAFEVRANKLAISMWFWVSFLVIALSIGAFIGAERLELLTNAMSAKNPNTGIIAMQSFLSVLSLGAPLWFAWLATKQIGQRFRLAEDYAFKASVAKAYEGYRKEAARIDTEFEKRLFNTALTRVEEPPLRLVEENSHGSPWHELLSSSDIKKFVNEMPVEIKDKIFELIKEGMGTVKDIAVSQKDKSTDIAE